MTARFHGAWVTALTIAAGLILLVGGNGLAVQPSGDNLCFEEPEMCPGYIPPEYRGPDIPPGYGDGGESPAPRRSGTNKSAPEPADPRAQAAFLAVIGGAVLVAVGFYIRDLIRRRRQGDTTW